MCRNCKTLLHLVFHLFVLTVSGLNNGFLQCNKLNSVLRVFNIYNEIYLHETDKDRTFFWRYDSQARVYIQADWLSTLTQDNLYGVLWNKTHVKVVDEHESKKFKGQVILYASSEIFINLKMRNEVELNSKINTQSRIYQVNHILYEVRLDKGRVNIYNITNSDNLVNTINHKPIIKSVFKLNNFIYGYTNDNKMLRLGKDPSEHKTFQFSEVLPCYYEPTIDMRYLSAALALLVCLILLSVLNICFLTNSLLNRNINQGETSLRVASQYPSQTPSTTMPFFSSFAARFRSKVRKPVQHKPATPHHIPSEVSTTGPQREFSTMVPPTNVQSEFSVKPSMNINSVSGCYKKP